MSLSACPVLTRVAQQVPVATGTVGVLPGALPNRAGATPHPPTSELSKRNRAPSNQILLKPTRVRPVARGGLSPAAAGPGMPGPLVAGPPGYQGPVLSGPPG